MNERDSDIVGRKRLLKPRHGFVLNPCGPPATRRAPHFEDIAPRGCNTSREGWIEEALPIEMIGWRPSLRLADILMF
jgi:hypothetical protein